MCQQFNIHHLLVDVCGNNAPSKEVVENDFNNSETK